MKRKNGTKTILMLAMAALILAGTVGGTLAFITTQADPVKNTLYPSKVTCAVDEPGWTDGDSVKENVSIRNTGDTAAYIRATVAANWCDTDGNILAPQTVDLNGNTGQGWKKAGDYYYYDPAVQAGGNTSNLINKYSPEPPAGVPKGAHLEMTVICQAVQAEGLEGVTSAQSAFEYVAAHNPGSGS